MGNWGSETYSEDIAPPLKDWLNNRVSGINVSDVCLSLVNRAQKNIWHLREWQRLYKDATLTITNNAASLPADFGREIYIGSDLSGSGKEDYIFKREGEIGIGYKITGSFSKSSGQTLTITFYEPYETGTSIKLRYVPYLEDFTGSGTEYSYFPANLIILQAQVIRTMEKGDSAELPTLLNLFDRALIDYSNLVQNNNSYHLLSDVRDRWGYPIQSQRYTLDGQIASSGYDPFPNSRRPGLR